MTQLEPKNQANQTNQTISEKADGKQRAFSSRFVEFLRALWQNLRFNWGLKLLSLVLALCLWAFVIGQDPTLTREKTFTDVNVSISGSETIKRNGFIVTSDLSSELSGVTLRAEVPQMQYDNAQASNYNLRVDLSRVTTAGDQELRIYSTNSSTYGAVSEIEPSTVPVTVEEYVARYRIPVTVETTGTMADGYYCSTPSVTPSLITVSGPSSLVNTIVRAQATIDLSSLPGREGSIRNSVPFELIDSNGNVVSSALLEITSESVLLDAVVLEQQIYPTKAIAISETGMVIGTPADGYEIKSISYSPATLIAAASSESLSALDSLFADTTVNVNGLGGSINQRVRVRQSSELVWLSQSSITVAVEIGQIISSRSFTSVPVQLITSGDGQKVTVSSTTADVVLSGPKLWLEQLSENNLLLTCDASGLTAGTYRLQLHCQVIDTESADFQVTVSPVTVSVTIE